MNSGEFKIIRRALDLMMDDDDTRSQLTVEEAEAARAVYDHLDEIERNERVNLTYTVDDVMLCKPRATHEQAISVLAHMADEFRRGLITHVDMAVGELEREGKL